MENPPGIPPTPFRFSNEELRALQECNSESFFYRSLPLSALMGIGTHLGVKSGHLSATRYGSAPKVALAMVAGYILGKISYQSKCAEKIMALPDSKLGAMLRERKRGGKYQESLVMDQPDIGKIFSDVPPSDVYSDNRRSESAPSYMDIDMERRQEDIDSSHWTRPNEPRMGDDLLLPPPPSRTITSYDELRQKNRDDFDSSRNKFQSRTPVRQDDSPPLLETRDPPPPSPPLREASQRNKSTNKYGDSWEK